MRISKGLGRRGAVRAIVAFFALSRAIAWQQDTPLPTQRLDPLIQKIVSEVSQEPIADILKKLREFTLKNTPIDQLVFGVKSVDRDGHESPVSAYWTQPRPPDR
jgi:hypothetical protein